MATTDERKTIERILADPRYWDAKHPEHTTINAEATRAFRESYSDPADEPAGSTIHVRAHTRRQNGEIIQVSEYDRSATIARSPASALSPSDEGRAFLKRNEGLKPKVYLDTADKSTIGFGHKIKPGESFPHGVTSAQAERMFDADIAEAAAAVQRLVKTDLSQPQFDALVSLVYNVGSGAFAKSAMLRKLNAGDVAAAATEFDDWDRITNQEGRLVPDGGLTKRRQREKKLFLNGAYR